MIKKPSGRKNTSAKKTELNDLFAELKGEYLETFPEKIDAIRGFWEKQDRENLQNEFHKIKGTGTTYGIPEVTTIAEMLEDMCKNNSEKLGAAILSALELFHKISHAYKHSADYDLAKDPLFRMIKVINEDMERAG